MSPKHKYTLFSMMKDEGHSLLEWVAYHHMIGFDNIAVYTNDCSDGTDAMLRRLQEMGYCQHFENDVPEGGKPQPNALKLAHKNPEIQDSEWIMVMDADEFVSIKCGDNTLSALMSEVPKDAWAIAMTWRFFGSNEIVEWNPGLVSESYTLGAPDDFRKGWGVKTMFRPANDVKFGIHRPKVKGGDKNAVAIAAMLERRWVNGSGVDMPREFNLSGWRSTRPTIGRDLVELNHYAVKSYESYLLRRVRGNVNNKVGKYGAEYFAIFDRNERPHMNVHDLAPRTRAVLEKFREDKVLRDLEETALAFHANRVNTLRETGEYDPWIKELREAGQTSVDELQEVLFFHHLPKEWQDKVKAMQASGIPDKEIAALVNGTKTARKTERRAAMAAAAATVGGPEVNVTTHGDETVEDASERHAKALAATKSARKQG
ncbi:MAG: glycosyltransferase family 2 protein [Pseudomonadota bacterium]